MAVAPRQLPLGLRIGITVLLLGLFYFGARVPLPFVHADRFVGMRAQTLTQVNVTALGINPLITSFLVVELGALLLSAGRRLRAGGSAGRRKLNRIALGLSLVVSAAQAAGIALFLERISLYPGAPVVDRPGWPFRLVLVCTLIAVTAALYLLGNVITTWGIGNGFCLLWLVTRVQPLLHDPESLRAGDLTYLSFLLLAGGLALFLYRVQAIEVREEGGQVGEIGEALTVPLPALPQSILPLNFAYALVGFAGLLPFFRSESARWPPIPLLAALLVLPLSLLLFSWLGSRRRILGNLPSGVTLEPGADGAIRRQLVTATALLAGLPLLFLATKAYAGIAIEIVPFSILLFAVATALDIYDHVRFVSNHHAVRLLELDSVHLASYLERRLASHDIPAVLQGYRARSLFLLLGPLFKMDLLVPAERFDEARKLVDAEIEEHLRAF